MLWWIISLGSLHASAQQVPASQAHWAHPEAGMPLVETYTPETYGADAQNWMALQDDSNMLYVANTGGVLTFDGARWQLIPVSNRSIVRGLAQGADGRIYVGAQNELGYLNPTPQGLRYVSLRSRIAEGPSDLGSIWSVQAVADAVYFLTFNGLYRWSISNETMRYWAPPSEDTSFFPMTTIRDTAYVGTVQDGLFAVEGDSLQLLFPVPDTPDGSTQKIRAVAPYGLDQILVATSESYFYVYDGRTLQRLNVSFRDDIAEALPYDLKRLSDGSYALATIGAGLFLFDAQGTLIRRFPFPQQPVLGIHEDHEGGIWAMLDGGIRRIDWNTPLSIFSGSFDDEIITDVVRHNDTLTVSTNQGMGTVVPGDEPGAPATLQKHPPFTQIWNLHQDSAGDLLAGTAGDLIRWEDGDMREGLGLIESHGFHVTAAPHAPNQLYVSTSRGIERFERIDNAGWQHAGVVRDDIGNFSRPAWANDSTLWVGTRYSGVVRVTVDAQGRPVSTQQLTTDHGLPQGHVMPFRFGDTILFSTEEGAHRFDPATRQFYSVEGPPYVPGQTREPRVLLAEDGTGRWWGNTGNGLGWWTRSDDDWTWQMRSLRRVAQSTVRAVLAEEVAWIATSKGLIRYQPQADTLSAGTVRVRSLASLPADSTLRATAAPNTDPGRANPPAFDYAHHSVRLRYAAPSYTQPHTTEYRVRLMGLSNTWSNWTTSAQRDFTNLPPGAYTFEVQARTARTGPSSITPYAFRILPPWYRTWWAYALYLMGGLGLLAGVVQWRTHTLRRQQRYLERVVAERTTEISRKNEQLAQQAKRLRSLDEAKSQFFANISHELRTPLTLILGPVRQLLLEASIVPSVRRRLVVVQRNAERLLNMVQQLLELARLEAGTFTIAPQQYDVGRRLARYARTFTDLGRTHDLDICVEHNGPPENARPAYADLDCLEQVMANLMSNAIKFTPAGGHIVVRIDETAMETRLLVSDTGIGIADEHHQAIFERFQQVDGSATRAHDGAGIGLALTKDLVEAHGGRITVRSTPGEGTTFTVMLPRGRKALPERVRPNEDTDADASSEVHTQADGAPAADAESDGTVPFIASEPRRTGDTLAPAPENGTDGLSTTPPGPPTPSRAPLVLVVDDNADMRTYIRSILAEEFRIIEAENGRKGLALAASELPDLVLADVMMPGMDGMTLTRKLRDTPDTATIPVILVTARADTASEVKGLADGASDYITKPFEPDVLQMRVHGVMQWMQRLKRRLRVAPQATHAPSDTEADSMSPDAAPAPDDAMSEFEREARAIVRDNLTEPGFDVDDLATAMAVSRSTLYRRARTHDTLSPAALVRDVRMSTAHTLLKANEGTVTEVAYAVGYESLSSFSDQFRSHFGYPPSQVSTPTSA